MQHINSYALKQLDRFTRGNLINSITGFKSANLLATKSNSGINNVAVFSSVTHLGSDPELFSFIQRPLGHGAGHTYYNLKDTGYITLNHINSTLVEKAHQSSVKYPEYQSEFDILEIESLIRPEFHAPFIKDASVQVAATYVNEYPIVENNCILVVCKITDVFLKEGIMLDDGWVNLETAGTVTINGLDAYAAPRIEKRLSYAQENKPLTRLPIS